MGQWASGLPPEKANLLWHFEIIDVRSIEQLQGNITLASLIFCLFEEEKIIFHQVDPQTFICSQT